MGFHRGLLGVTIHDPDGSLACKGSLEVELGQGYLRRAWRIAGRPQAVASILRIDDDDVYRPGLLVLGPP